MQLSKNEKMTFEFDCKDCDEGKQEVGPICFRPASNCCGGCYQEVECETCEGSGTLYVELDYDDLLELVLTAWNVESDASHLVILNNIK